MDLPQYKILAADLSQHALLILDCPSCRTIAEIPYPVSVVPVKLIVTPDGKKAYMPANDQASGKGCLYVLNLDVLSLYQLPIDMPLIGQFSLHPNGTDAYMTGADNTLCHLDTSSLTLAVWGSPESLAACTGLTVTDAGIFTIWEEDHRGALLNFDRNGQLAHEATFSAVPTSITAAPPSSLIITFTSSQEAGEGVLLLHDTLSACQEPAIITTLCPKDLLSHQNYPVYTALSSNGSTAYIVNEESASVSILDLSLRAIIGCILVGRGISRLYILPGNTFALASSSLFADLILIDLVNNKVLSTTLPQHELHPDIALLPV